MSTAHPPQTTPTVNNRSGKDVSPMISATVRRALIVAAATAASLGAAGLSATAATAALDNGSTIHTTHQAAAAPVSWNAGGRTITVGGLPTSSYQASGEHKTIVVQLASDTSNSNTNSDTNGISNALNGNGQTGGAPTGGATNAMPATFNTVPTHTSGGAVSIDVVGALITGGLIFYAVKHRNHRWGWIFVSIAFGTFIGAGTFGIMIRSLVDTGISSAANILSSTL